MSETLYEILKIPNGSSSEEIKKAHHKLMLKYHPDTRQKGLSEEKTHEYDQALLDVQEAYEALSDANIKKVYDDALGIVEEHGKDEWNDGNGSQGTSYGWNIPAGNPTVPYMPFTSGSAAYASSVNYNHTSGSTWYVFTKARYTVDVANVFSLGLAGLSTGDIVYLSISSNPPTMSTGHQAGTSWIPCKVIHAHYSTAPGLPAAGHFELEEL